MAVESLRTAQLAYKKGQLVRTQDENRHKAFTLLSGWAVRFCSTRAGHRQILSFILPGELIGADFLGGSENHFAVRALTDIQLCEFDPEQLVSLLTKTHDTTMHMLAVLGHHCKDLEETIYSLGKCSAMERMANLIVGLRARIAASEGSGALQFDLPLRRYDFADALGLTPVHVSRTFAQLKSNRVLEFRSGILQILNEARLLELASALYRSRAPMNADAANEAAASSGL